MHLTLLVAASIAAAVLWLPATAVCAYLLVLTCLSFGRGPPLRKPSRALFFDVIVPAHNEAAGIGRSIASLQRLHWPGGKYRIVVVADNCTDATAAVARAAGATVLERQDVTLRGKGYALAHGFEWSANDALADAVVVIDADSVVSENLLESFAARLAAGEHALQAHYGVLNPMQSWRTRLMAIALGAIHKVRSRGRERLRLSCGIRGNGWCVTHTLLRAVPYRSFSLTEDVEFGIELGLAGFRVGYCDDAQVSGEMVTGERAARTQRQRWESGRIGLIRRMVPALLRAAVVRRSLVCADLACDLLVLPLSYVVANVGALIVTGMAILWLSDSHGWRAVPLIAGVADALALAIYVGRGWSLSGTGRAGLYALVRVPTFLVWKFIVALGRSRPDTWIRTEREKQRQHRSDGGC